MEWEREGWRERRKEREGGSSSGATREEDKENGKGLQTGQTLKMSLSK